MLTGIVAVVLGLGVMVVIHEFGHFIVARLFGVRVDVFSFGLGPRLFGVKRGATDYRLSAFPVGGYVRMAGEFPSDERRGDPDEFLSKPRWQRMFIILAGPTTNLILAVILTAGYFIGYGVPESRFSDQPVVIAGVLRDSPAQAAGIQSGDRVVTFGGNETPTWDSLLFRLAVTEPGSSQPVVVDRNGQRVTLHVQSEPQPFNVVGYPDTPISVLTVVSSSPAERAGLLAGDLIVSVNGQSPYPFAELIRQNEGKAVDLAIQRGDQKQNLMLQPQWDDPGDGKGARWQIGIGYSPATAGKQYSAPQAVVKAAEHNAVQSGRLVYLVGQLFAGRVSFKQLMGPVGIVRESSRAAGEGFGPLISLMAVLSLNLGVLNLLPIPILDGGHILMLSVEGLLRKDLSLKVKERFLTAGMVFLLAVFLFVTIQDIGKMIGGQ